MKCPKCGKEMPEGSLYCEYCGEDIHIVPDFEPELEQSIQQNMDSILEGLAAPEPEGSVPKRHFPEIKRWQLALSSGILLALAAGIVIWQVYGYNSKDYQMNRGQRYVSAGNYDRAISCYSRALVLDENDIELTFLLAEAYYLKNNKVEYEYLLRRIVQNPAASTEQLERAYGRLIAIYRAREDYQTINDLLLASNNAALLSTYQNYVARAPEFSIKEGYYTSIQPLKLTASGAGKIYYTLDGSEPDGSSSQYTAPIILEKGDYLIKACFINDNGIVSPVAVKEYHIEIDEIPEPVVSALSGEYYLPVKIEVTGGEGEIFYTTDGTTPTYSSTAYTGPIPMPLGKSTFKFAQIVNGVTGNVVERSYQLTLSTVYTPENAVADVTEYVLETGKIHDREGHFGETAAAYRYEYQYVITIDESGDFYIVAELLYSSENLSERTGTNYAVNAYTGELYRLEQDKRGRYTLIEIDRNINSEEEE